MFKFFVKFKVVTEMDYISYDADKELIAERERQLRDVCEHFSIACTNFRIKVLTVPGYGTKKLDNVVKLGTGKFRQLSCDCIIAPEKWQTFYEEVNDYVKDKNYATFMIYTAP